MNAAVVSARLRATDPQRWRAAAAAWRRWAALAGRLAAEFPAHLARLGAAWSGAAATAAARRLAALRHRLIRFRLLCWQADQALSEFAAALERAKAAVSGDPAAEVTATRPPAAAGAGSAIAATADAAAAARLAEIATAVGRAGRPPGPDRPGCGASPAAVRRWWAGLTSGERQWLLCTEAAWLAARDGIPVTDRDAANRLLLDDRRRELERALAEATGGPRRRRLLDLRRGLEAIADRLDGDAGPRAYLLRLDLTGEGRTVLALGDLDRADNVLTHVPGMTAGLASAGGELARAERVAVRATELAPGSATGAVLWLDYDAPDFVDEAASARRAEAAAPALRTFQEGLRATHDGPAARQTVLGHSYGSLVVGRAAAGAGLEADSVVFVGSPGVGVDTADRVRGHGGEVWATTSRTDVIQYAAVAPGTLIRDLAVAGAIPVAGPLLAFGRPERDLWFGTNPSDPAFGARTFAAQADAGHLGYWDRGRPALDMLAAVALGTAR